MKLVRFVGSGIHGYLSLDIRFHASLTFVTGINGSGKTSALNAIAALISPDLRTLANLVYTSIHVDFHHAEIDYSIGAVSDGKIITIMLSPGADEFTFTKYAPDTDLPASRQIDLEAQHYNDLVSSNSANSVLNSIATLPNPMFLGIDRRARFEHDLTKRSRYVFARSSRLTRNAFATSLSNSILDAEELAEDKYRDALIQSGRKAEQLQSELLLNLLSEERVDQRRHPSLGIPNEADLRDLAAIRRDLESLPQLLRLPPKEIRARVTPFLDSLQRYASAIPRDIDVAKLMRQDNVQSDLFSAVLGWSANQGRLTKFKQVAEIVSKYNIQKSDLMQPTDNYLLLINSFLEDSGKHIKFDETGYISVEIGGLQGQRPIFLLSSGEAQIFVILTHLAFNPLAQNNVFIIDEPELSLHVQWQEMFVDSIISSNPNIQYILATHSPSIILDRTNLCVDISKRVKRRSKGN